MSQELKVKLLLAALGMIFGMVPMVYAYMKKQILWGAAALIVCTVLSVVGLPYLSIPVAALAFYVIYVLSVKLNEKQQKKNRSAYKKNLKAQLETEEGRLSGYIENKRTASAAWPPVTPCVDEEAVAEYQRMVEADAETALKEKTASVDQ